MTILTVCANGARGADRAVHRDGLGDNLAPPLTVHGSDNDWGTKCDLGGLEFHRYALATHTTSFMSERK